MRYGSVEKLAKDIRRFVLDSGEVLSVDDVEKRGAALKLTPYEIASAIDSVTGTKALQTGTVRIGRIELQRDRRSGSDTRGMRFLCLRSADEATKKMQVGSMEVAINTLTWMLIGITDMKIAIEPAEPWDKFEKLILMKVRPDRNAWREKITEG